MADNHVIHAEDVLPVRSRVSWGAIFAGAAVAFAVYLVLTLLGAAIGLSVRNQVEGDNLTTGAAMWAVLSVVVSLFIGGYVTSQCVAGENTMEAAVHGLLMWAAMFVGLGILASMGASAGFNALLGMTQMGQAAANQTGAQNWEQAARAAGLNDEQIANMRQQMNQARAGAQDPQTRQQVADQTAEAATRVAWWTLFGVVLSMLAAVGGGLLGAGPSPHLVAIMGRGHGVTTTTERTHHTGTGTTTGSTMNP